MRFNGLAGVMLDRLQLMASNQTAAVDLMRAVLGPLGYSEWEEPSPERGNDVVFGSDARAPMYRICQARPAEDRIDVPHLWFRVADQAVFDEIVRRVETVMAAWQSETYAGPDGSRSFSAFLPGFASIVVGDA